MVEQEFIDNHGIEIKGRQPRLWEKLTLDEIMMNLLNKIYKLSKLQAE